ncbi:hypothetical protein REPUB_Repub06bG0168500 [Reevesia pubescens]
METAVHEYSSCSELELGYEGFCAKRTLLQVMPLFGQQLEDQKWSGFHRLLHAITLSMYNNGLPTYKRSSTLKAKLRYAISCNAGFELS